MSDPADQQLDPTETGKAESGIQQLVVRLARDDEEIHAAQSLRYRIFYEEMGAKPTSAMVARHIDFDDFDSVCDHLLVLDPARGDGPEAVVGTYRLIRRSVGESFGRFYSASEYELDNLLANAGQFMELGRSCVDVAYRTGSAMRALWGGIAEYVWEHKVEVMFGCASLPGTDPDRLAEQLSYLHHYHPAPPHLCPRALSDRYVPMDRLPKDRLDPRRVLASLPPLIKGYLRLGGFVGDGAVIDHQFNTTDVCVMVKTDLITDRYVKHYSARDA